MRKLLYAIAAFMIVAIAALAVLVMTFDPNQYKPLIVKQTKKATGLDLVIAGDLKWQLFPSVGIDMGRVTLKNPAGYLRENLLEVDQVAAGVSVMPLFSHQIHIGEIRLNGLDLQLETRADGQSNLDALRQTKNTPAQHHAPEPTAAEPTVSGSAGDSWQITVAGVNVSHARIAVLDAITRQKTLLEDVNLSVSEFLPGQWTAFELSGTGQKDQMQFSVQGQGDFHLTPDYTTLGLRNINVQAGIKGDGLPQNPLNIALKGEMATDLQQKLIQFTGLKLQLNDLAVDGRSTVKYGLPIPQVRFNLHSKNVDLDAFLQSSSAKKAGDTASVPVSTSPAPVSAAEKEPDLSALKSLDVSGKVQIDRLKVSQAELTKVALKGGVQKGVVQLTVSDAHLYQGQVKANILLDANHAPAGYQVHKSISEVQILPLLKAVAAIDKFEGTGSIDIDVVGKGLSEARLKKGLQGKVQVNLADGAINGINIAQMIRSGYARIKGSTLPDEDQTVQKTDFSEASATFHLNNGVATTDNIQMKSPLLRIHGEGAVNYLEQTQNMLVRTSFVGSLAGQGGKNIDELRDVTIPLKVTGSWQKPHYQLVFDDVLKQKAKKELNRGLKKLDEKIKDEKTREAVNQLLNKLF